MNSVNYTLPKMSSHMACTSAFHTELEISITWCSCIVTDQKKAQMQIDLLNCLPSDVTLAIGMNTAVKQIVPSFPSSSLSWVARWQPRLRIFRINIGFSYRMTVNHSMDKKNSKEIIKLRVIQITGCQYNENHSNAAETVKINTRMILC